MDEGKGGALTAVVGLVLGLVMLMTLVIVAVDEDEQDPCKPTGTSSSADGGVPDGEYSKPLKSSDYTESSGYRSPDRPTHRGTDMAAPMHTPIFAFADGVVVNAGPSNDGPQGFGNWVVIDHEGKDGDGKFSTVYGHMPLGDITVKPGDKVKAGQHIAGVGSEGGSSGPHLHFEVWPGGRDGGKDVDPVPWVDKAKDPGSGGGEAPKDASKDEKKDDPAKKASAKAPKKSDGGGNADGGVLVVGDSISEGSRSQLEAKIPGVKVNARVSRPFDEGANIIRRDIDSLPGTVVIALGTNGGVSASDYKALVEEVKGKGSKVVGVNTYADRDWTEATNAAIDGAGIPVADWHGAVEKDSSLLGGDGLHPSPAGQAKFAELVAGIAG
uniref:peptidoglycan DD-metalloendopeptidase family protein n=1 Tax=Dietzia sp. TaxID=1871616 RepID=UPI002FDB5E19